VSLYVDVRLTIEIAGMANMTPAQAESIVQIRTIGTNAATAAFALFLLSIGLLGWIASPTLGLVSTIVALIAFIVLGYVWYAVQHIF